MAPEHCSCAGLRGLTGSTKCHSITQQWRSPTAKSRENPTELSLLPSTAGPDYFYPKADHQMQPPSASLPSCRLDLEIKFDLIEKYIFFETKKKKSSLTGPEMQTHMDLQIQSVKM